MLRDHLVSRYLLGGAALMWASVCGAQEASVSLDGRPLFTIRASLGAYGPEHRAADITRRLAEAAHDASVMSDEVGVTPGEDAFLVTAGLRPLLAVTPADAQKAGLPQPELARQRAAVIRAALVQYRRAHSFELLLERLGRFTALWLLFLVLAVAVRWVRRMVLKRLEHWAARLAASPRLEGFHQLMGRPVLFVGQGLLRLSLRFCC